MGIRNDISRTMHDIFVNVCAAGAFGIPALRVRLLRIAGMNIGPATKIHGKCWFGGTDIRIGARSWINYGTTFDNAARIELGDDCLVGPQVMFLTSTHKMGPSARRGADAVSSPIHVSNGCWIGARSIIMPGVTIGEGCVIAAGALVRFDCLPDTLYAGIPARPIRSLN